LRSPQPSREIIAIWPTQRPLGRAASEFVKTISTRFQKNITGVGR
jgi:hypothetical protein